MSAPRVQVSFTPSTSGVYLLESRLSHPIPVGDGTAIKEMAESMGNDVPEEVGIAGMLQPAQYQSDGSLVAIDSNPTGHIFSLEQAIAVFDQQCAGQTVSQPYIFNPDLAEFLVENGHVVGWRRILFALPNFAEAGAFQASAGEDGSSPIVQSAFNQGTPSMYGTSGGIFSSLTNLWSDAGNAAKIGMVVAGAGILVVGWQLSVVAAGIGALKLAVGAVTGVALAVGAGYAVSIVLKPLVNGAANINQGANAYFRGQPAPAGFLQGMGYYGAASLDAMKKTSDVLLQGGQAAIEQINRMSNLLDRAYQGAGTLVKGLLVVGGVLGGAWLFHKLFLARR